ncbi:hypothetical protein BO78DRAFT_448281 [Aspergillus sclerotiicarbonarius CBS 121057]|uniref:Uncharacterized protein n=1 Tax=Aspergillus sclerotiicarbonarius (strain CBS 121057 / IBT 28362) TaxID=1448318 RepID=A0A319EU03_ASPSB|nr:hypothetical protein BO78DRAFT_448281 [Aspergillus sclerotiicarbonarius CBS 121057]
MTTAAVAKVLDEAKVRYVMWGGTMYQLMQVWEGASITFVIPDQHLETAVSALIADGYSDQNAWHSDPDWDCPQKSISGAYTWPAHPFSPKEGLPFLQAIGLLRKSQWLFTFPDPPVGFPTADDPIFMSNHDLHLNDWKGTGSFRDFYPVKILKPVPWVESLILQEVCDWCVQKSPYVTWPWLEVVEQFHRNSARLLPPELFSPRHFRQPLGAVYERLTVVDDNGWSRREIDPLLDQIWEDMRAKGTLPNPIFRCVDPDFKESLEFRKQLRGLSGKEIEDRFGEEAD